MATKFVAMRVEESLLNRIDALAAAKNVSRSQCVLDLVRDGLDDEEIAIQAMTNPVISQALLGAMAQPEVLRAMTGVMRDQLTDEQLELFSKAMHGLGQQIEKHQPIPVVVKKRAARVSKKKRKLR